MTLQHCALLTGHQIPDPHRSVDTAAGQQLPAAHLHRAHRVDLASVALQHRLQLTRHQIPDPAQSRRHHR